MKKNRLLNINQSSHQEAYNSKFILDKCSQLQTDLISQSQSLHEIEKATNIVKDLYQVASESYSSLTESELKELIFNQRLKLENLFGSLGISKEDNDDGDSLYSKLNGSYNISFESYSSHSSSLYQQHLEHLKDLQNRFNKIQMDGRSSFLKTVGSWFKWLTKSTVGLKKSLEDHMVVLTECQKKLIDNRDNLQSIIEETKQDILTLTEDETLYYVLLDGLKDTNIISSNMNDIINYFPKQDELVDWFNGPLGTGDNITQPSSILDYSNPYYNSKDIRFSSKYVQLPKPKHLKNYFLFSITNSKIIYVSKDKNIRINPKVCFSESFNIEEMKITPRTITINTVDELIKLCDDMVRFIEFIINWSNLHVVKDLRKFEQVRSNVAFLDGIVDALLKLGIENWTYGEASIGIFCTEILNLQYSLLYYILMYSSDEIKSLSVRIQEISNLI